MISQTWNSHSRRYESKTETLVVLLKFRTIGAFTHHTTPVLVTTYTRLRLKVILQWMNRSYFKAYRFRNSYFDQQSAFIVNDTMFGHIFCVANIMSCLLISQSREYSSSWNFVIVAAACWISFKCLPNKPWDYRVMNAVFEQLHRQYHPSDKILRYGLESSPTLVCRKHNISDGSHFNVEEREKTIEQAASQNSGFHLNSELW